jgi:hypothetical protein
VEPKCLKDKKRMVKSVAVQIFSPLDKQSGGFFHILEAGSNYLLFNKFRLVFLNFLFWIPTLTLPFLRGGNPVELGSTQFPPPMGEGRVGERGEGANVIVFA